MTLHRLDLTHPASDFCNNVSMSQQNFNITTQDQIAFRPFVDYANQEQYTLLRAWSAGTHTLTNCTIAISSNGYMGDKVTISPTSLGSYSCQLNFQHLTSTTAGCSGTFNRAKSYQISGTVGAPPLYGLQCFNTSGELRLDFSKRNLRLHGVINGIVATSPPPATTNITIAGLGYPSVNDWLVVQTRPQSLYRVGSIITAANSPTGTGTLQLVRQGTGSSTWPTQLSNVYYNHYQVFNDTDTLYTLQLFRI